VCAVTTFQSEEGTGCAGFTQVIVTMLCVNDNKNMMRTIMRHEIGHVLGLAHNDVPGDLMQPVVPEKGHPLHATPDEVRLLRELYND
jgi:predicted Zn-dependent protease